MDTWPTDDDGQTQRVTLLWAGVPVSPVCTPFQAHTNRR